VVPTSGRPVPPAPGSGGPAGEVDRTVGSKRIGPGLAQGPSAEPGSSRGRAAAVQPSGYGLDAGHAGQGGQGGQAVAGGPGSPAGPGGPRGPAGPDGPGGATGDAGPGPGGSGSGSGDAVDPGRSGEERAGGPPGVVRRVTVAGLVVVAVVLAVGGALVWMSRPRHLDTAAVESEVGAVLTRRLGGEVTVGCPDGPELRAGATLDCTATDGPGTRRTVRVTLLDDDGRYRWELVQSR
jgi:hypothetical protein